MAVTKNGFLVGLLAFLCLSLSSANRVLKDNDAEQESISDNVSLGQDGDIQNFNPAELKSTVPKGSIPKFSSVGLTNGDCCNYGNNCGAYACPPSYECGGNSGCQSCYTCSPSSWQGCQGCQGSPCSWQGCQGCQGCQGSSCQGCQRSPPPCGCEVLVDNNSKVQQESFQTADVGVVPTDQPFYICSLYFPCIVGRRYQYKQLHVLFQEYKLSIL